MSRSFVYCLRSSDFGLRSPVPGPSLRVGFGFGFVLQDEFQRGALFATGIGPTLLLSLVESWA